MYWGGDVRRRSQPLVAVTGLTTHASAAHGTRFSGPSAIERGWRVAVLFKTPCDAWATIRPMSLETRLGWVIVYVDEPPAAAEFYEKTLAWRGDLVARGGSSAQPDRAPTKPAFASYELGKKTFDGGARRGGTDGQPPNAEIALTHEDVDAAYGVALEAGGAALAEPQDKPQ